MNKVYLLNLLKVSSVSTLLALSLYGCASTPPPEEEDDDDLVSVYTPEPAWKEEFRKLSNSQLQSKAINALLAGDEILGAQYLEILLEEQPNSYIGLLLERQINLPPSDILGQRYVVHEVKKGETLMDLSRRFTGDKFKFYSLAKFNDIDVPGALPDGILLKVPNNSNQYTPDPNRKIVEEPKKTKSSKSTARKPEKPKAEKVTQAVTAAPKVPVAEQANELYSNKRYSDLVALRESNIVEFNNDPKLNEQAARSYLALAQGSYDKKDFNVASSRLAEAKRLDQSSGKLSEEVSTLSSQIQVGSLLEKAKSQEKQGDLLAAINTHKVILTVEPENRVATRQQAKLVNQLTNDYFQSSLKSRESQDHKAELVWLNKILSINPTYQKAIQRKLIVDLLVQQ